jgi:hypothetical protein
MNESMSRMPRSLLLIALCSLTACTSAGRRPEPPDRVETPASATPQSVRYGVVHRLDGRSVHLSRFAQDRVTTRTLPDGRVVTHVEPLEYLLLVVSQSECKWAKQLVQGLAGEAADLRKLGVNVVGLLHEKKGHPVREWTSLERGGVTLVEDRKGALYDFYVEDRAPAIKVIDAWGNLRLSAEGYMEPAALIRKSRDEDFRPVPPGAG